MGRPIPLVMIAFLLVGTLRGAAAADPAATSPSPPTQALTTQPQARKVLHLHVRGDLDCLRLARDFADTLAAARDDGVEVLLLELSGNRWRADVIHAMAAAIKDPGSGGGQGRAAPRRLLALLDDEIDHRVGFGQASLAMLADACAVSPRTMLVFEPADDLRATAPPDTDWERVDRELQGLVYLAARDRRADALLNAVLPRPSGPVWAAPAADVALPWRLAPNQPEHPAAALIVPPETEGRATCVKFDSATAERLGIATCQAKDAGLMLALQGLRARPIIRKELVSGLNESRAKLNRLIGQLDDGLRAVDIDLAQAAKLRGLDAPRQKREAGERSRRAVADAEKRVIEAETLMVDYPELLASLPPGRTPVGQDPAKHPMLWRWRFQDIRKEIDRLLASAESLSRTP